LSGHEPHLLKDKLSNLKVSGAAPGRAFVGHPADPGSST
jgi:hypothetical protein